MLAAPCIGLCFAVAMVKKGQGPKAGKMMSGIIGTSRALAVTIHNRARSWDTLPVNVIVCILGSLPAAHRRTLIKMGHQTLPELHKSLRDILKVKVGQVLPTRMTQALIMDAIVHSYLLQKLPIPPAGTLVRLLCGCLVIIGQMN